MLIASGRQPHHLQGVIIVFFRQLASNIIQDLHERQVSMQIYYISLQNARDNYVFMYVINYVNSLITIQTIIFEHFLFQFLLSFQNFYYLCNIMCRCKETMSIRMAHKHDSLMSIISVDSKKTKKHAACKKE